MPALATENWSKARYKRGESAYREWFVTGVTNDDEAAAAVPYQLNSTHQYDSRLVAEQPETVERVGVLAWFIGVNFRRPAFGDVPIPPNPIDQRPHVKWIPTTEGGPADIDALGNPIRNSAGDLPSSLPTGFDTFLTLDLTRIEASFDPSFVLGFIGFINSDQFTVYIGKGQYRVVEPGQCCCRFIGPDDELVVGDEEYLRVRYVFEFRKYMAGTESLAPQFRSAFQHHFADTGQGGWYIEGGGSLSSAAPGNIWDTENQPLTRDTYLNGLGQPLNSFLTVIGLPAQINPSLPPGMQSYGTSAGKAIVYQRHLSTAFTALGI